MCASVYQCGIHACVHPTLLWATSLRALTAMEVASTAAQSSNSSSAWQGQRSARASVDVCQTCAKRELVEKRSAPFLKAIAMRQCKPCKHATKTAQAFTALSAAPCPGSCFDAVC